MTRPNRFTNDPPDFVTPATAAAHAGVRFEPTPLPTKVTAVRMDSCDAHAGANDAENCPRCWALFAHPDAQPVPGFPMHKTAGDRYPFAYGWLSGAVHAAVASGKPLTDADRDHLVRALAEIETALHQSGAGR